jgi:hypothetical protein
LPLGSSELETVDWYAQLRAILFQSGPIADKQKR